MSGYPADIQAWSDQLIAMLRDQAPEKLRDETHLLGVAAGIHIAMRAMHVVCGIPGACVSLEGYLAHVWALLERDLKVAHCAMDQLFGDQTNGDQT